MQRVGIFSGTFDPVHKGHIAFALLALEKAELDEVYLAPEVKPRRKPQVTHYAHRLAMLELATRPYAKVRVLELPDRYFSATRTLPKLEQKFPHARIVMLLGSDLFEHMPSWPNISTLLSKVGLIIGARGNYEVAEALSLLPRLPVQPLEFHVLDSVERHASSASIRETLQNGKASKELLPSVAIYARKHWLYHDLAKAAKR